MTPASIRSAVAYIRGDAADRNDQGSTCEAIARQHDCRIGHIFEDEPSPVRQVQATGSSSPNSAASWKAARQRR